MGWGNLILDRWARKAVICKPDYSTGRARTRVKVDIMLVGWLFNVDVSTALLFMTRR